MFNRKDCRWFIAGFTLCGAGLAAFALDPEESGLGMLSLWIAPPVFLAGLIAIVPGIINRDLWMNLRPELKGQGLKYAGLAIAFFLSLAIYIITLEPTASLWDCSEFIASAYKLQTPHTPGNPLLLLLGRIFSMFSFNDSARVAWCINMMSAVFASLTIAIVFLTAHSIISRIVSDGIVAIMSALAGCLVLAVSDTFWFSAIEAETYAASSFFMMLILWLIIKGLEFPSRPTRARVLVLIFYVAGLSFSIHPMSLLALPLLPIAWYLKDRKGNFKNISIALAIGIFLVLFINRFVAVGIFEVAFYLDLFFVNALKLPFFSGAVATIIVFITAYVVLLRKFPNLQRYTYASLFLLAGFMPYMVLFIRSSYNLPIDEGNPQNLALIKAYMNREGYPTRPLLFGPYFDAEVTEIKPVKKIFYKSSSRYEFAGMLSDYRHTPGRQTILPRIYSNDPDHIQSYRAWLDLKENEKPTYAHNLKFMLQYQLNHMYWRYVMFNFAGRKSDIQNSPWLKPWEPIHARNAHIETKARNQYFMVPLLFGFIGAIFLFQKSRKDFILFFGFFALTGFVLALYLNSTPNEPRERDYIYVGSYIAFALFIAIGISFALNLIRSKLQRLLAITLVLIVPSWMFFQNFDDHNRRGRTIQIDNAKNILSSCEQNSILFTGGDNDTFPLWYLQEVEGFRDDVRVVVLSYLNTDWYINQLRLPVNDSPAFKLSLDKKAYRQYGPNDVIYVQEQLQGAVDCRKFLGLLNQEHPALTIRTNNEESYSLLPSRELYVNSAQSTVASSDSSADKRYKLKVKGNYLSKNGLAILDLLTNNPDRAFHFNFTSIGQTGLNLDEYIVQKGQIYQLRPDHHSARDIPMDTNAMFENLFTRCDLTNLANDGFYLSYEDHEMRIVQPLRQSYNALAMQLLTEGDNVRAVEVLDKALKYLYSPTLTPSFPNIQAADLLMRVGRNKDAETLALSLFEHCYNQNDGLSDGVNDQLLHWSAELLRELGKPQYLALVKNQTMK